MSVDTYAAALLCLTRFRPEETAIGRALVNSALADLWAVLCPPPAPDPGEPETAFEEWLIERWLKDIRSDEFRASAQGQHLMAEWERGR